jgi:ribonuclease HI
MIAKCIWKRRNGVMHGGLFTHPSEVIKQATRLLNDYREANAKKMENVESPLPATQGWEPSVINFLKANWDVAIRQTENIMGIGVSICDGEGHVIATLSEQVKAVYDPITDEAMAARRAVEFCHEVGVFDVILEGDSLLVVKVVKDKKPNWLPYGQIIDDIKKDLGSIRQWNIRHVKRAANKAAYELSSFATRNSALKCLVGGTT